MKHLALECSYYLDKKAGEPIFPGATISIGLLIKWSGLRFKAIALALQIFNTNVITIILY